jgi:hypothetical protein
MQEKKEKSEHKNSRPSEIESRLYYGISDELILPVTVLTIYRTKNRIRVAT